MSTDLEEVEKVTTTDSSDVEMDDTFEVNLSSGSVLGPGFNNEDAARNDAIWDVSHKPMYWSAMGQCRETLSKGKQAQDVSLWFPNQFRPRWDVGNLCGHFLTQVSECGNKLNQA